MTDDRAAPPWTTGSGLSEPTPISMEKTQQFSGLLHQGPLEFCLGAEVSPSLRALRYAQDDEQMVFVDLVLAAYYICVSQKAPPSERPDDLLLDVISDASPASLLWAEANSLLGVYRASCDDLESAMFHFQSAVDVYRLRGRDDALAVCFSRHSKAMFEHGETRTAIRSLMQAESFASKIDRPLYKEYCQLVRLQGMYLQGRVEQAAVGASEIETHEGMGLVYQSRLLALKYAGRVVANDTAAAEILWQSLNKTQLEHSPCGLVAIHARVCFLLSQQLFSAAAETVLNYLQAAPLASKRSQRKLLDTLMNSGVVKQLPRSILYYFEGMLEGVEIETQRSRSFDIDLVCYPRDGT